MSEMSREEMYSNLHDMGYESGYTKGFMKVAEECNLDNIAFQSSGMDEYDKGFQTGFMFGVFEGAKVYEEFLMLWSKSLRKALKDG